MKLEERLESIKEFTKLDIQRIANISERTLERNIKDLVNMGYVCKKKKNRRISEKNIYYINPYFSYTTEFTTFETSSFN